MSLFTVKTEATSLRSISLNFWRYQLLELPEIYRYRSLITDDKRLSIVKQIDVNGTPGVGL